MGQSMARLIRWWEQYDLQWRKCVPDSELVNLFRAAYQRLVDWLLRESDACRQIIVSVRCLNL